MFSTFVRAVVLTVVAITIFSCGEPQAPIATVAPSAEQERVGASIKGGSSALAYAIVVPLPTDVSLAGFVVHYDGRIVAGGFTTFSYSVTGPGTDMHFRLELPSCAPALAATNPTNGVTSNNDQHINPGISWHPSVTSAAVVTWNFSITFAGEVQEGIILTSVKSTSVTDVGQIAGPCARVFSLNGMVYTDANRNANRDVNEVGIPGVTVNLLDQSAVFLGSTTTGLDGSYLFELLPAGSYTVEVETSSVAQTQTTYVSLTTSSSRSVTLGPSSAGNDFGFAPKTQKLINDLKFGILPTNGLNANWWKKQLQVAISGKGNATVSHADLLSYIAAIEGLLLPEPYSFPAGNDQARLQAAFDLLNNPVKTELDDLKKQLLATEFNHVSTRGIYGTDPALQLIILEWCETLAANAMGLSGTITPAAAITTSLSDGVSVCKAISSGGGGGDF